MPGSAAHTVAPRPLLSVCPAIRPRPPAAPAPALLCFPFSTSISSHPASVSASQTHFSHFPPQSWLPTSVCPSLLPFFDSVSPTHPQFPSSPSQFPLSHLTAPFLFPLSYLSFPFPTSFSPYQLHFPPPCFSFPFPTLLPPLPTSIFPFLPQFPLLSRLPRVPPGITHHLSPSPPHCSTRYPNWESGGPWKTRGCPTSMLNPSQSPGEVTEGPEGGEGNPHPSNGTREGDWGARRPGGGDETAGKRGGTPWRTPSTPNTSPPPKLSP